MWLGTVGGLALVSLAAVVTPVAAVVGCTLDGEKCICMDAEGEEWDVTAFNPEFTTTGDTTGCSICVPPYNYHLSICNNVPVPQSIGCTSTANAAVSCRLVHPQSSAAILYLIYHDHHL